MLGKSFIDLTSEDIASYCTKGHIESVTLDYKMEISKTLYKTIAAMSNTQGGYIILGVQENEKTGAPEKWEGIECKDKIEEQLYQTIASNVYPPSNTTIKKIEIKESSKCYIVINISKGNTIHYLHTEKGDRIYYRTGNIALPETQPDHIKMAELIKRIQYEEELRESIMDRAIKRNEIIGKEGYGPQFCIFMMPIVPDQKLISFNTISIDHACGSSPLIRKKVLENSYYRENYRPTQDGVVFYDSTFKNPYIEYGEYGVYGYIWAIKPDEKKVYNVDDVVCDVKYCVDDGIKYIVEDCKYTSGVIINIRLFNIKKSDRVWIYNKQEHFTSITNNANPLDNRINIKREFRITEWSEMSLLSLQNEVYRSMGAAKILSSKANP